MHDDNVNKISTIKYKCLFSSYLTFYFLLAIINKDNLDISEISSQKFAFLLNKIKKNTLFHVLFIVKLSKKNIYKYNKSNY